jgi:predicted dehydrogenase
MAETHTYFPTFLYCRSRFRRGDFGRLVFADAQNLYHPTHYEFWARDHYANYPPLLYATHTTTMLAGVTGSRLTRVAATGFAGIHDSVRAFNRLEVFRDNEFSSESGLFLADDGSSCRITEARVIGNYPGSDAAFSLWGTEGSFEGHVGHYVWSAPDPPQREEVTDQLGTGSSVYPEREVELPESFAELGKNAFAFLVDDFVRACLDGRRAFNDVWQAARLCAPGIVAHASACRDSEWLEIPDFGSHPDGPWQPDALDLSAFDVSG